MCARWIDDIWRQRLARDVFGAGWWSDIVGVFRASELDLESTWFVNVADGGVGVRWCDLVVWPAGRRASGRCRMVQA